MTESFKANEVRIINERTGGEKGQKLARFDLVPVRALTALAEHFGKGAEKYEDRNWERGVDWSLAYAACLRHLTAWWGGEELDEDGNSHLAAAMWHCSALIEYAATHPELDDRPKTQVAKAQVAAKSMSELWKDVAKRMNESCGQGIAPAHENPPTFNPNWTIPQPPNYSPPPLPNYAPTIYGLEQQKR